MLPLYLVPGFSTNLILLQAAFKKAEAERMEAECRAKEKAAREAEVQRIKQREANRLMWIKHTGTGHR